MRGKYTKSLKNITYFLMYSDNMEIMLKFLKYGFDWNK